MAGILRLRRPPPIFYGRLYAWGYNSSGGLGLPTLSNYLTPTQVGTAADWRVYAAAGNNFSHWLRSGALFASGDNLIYGMLGDGTLVKKSSPVQIGAATDWTYVRSGDSAQYAGGISGGKLFMWGRGDSGQLGLGSLTSRSSPTQVGSATNWTALATGAASTLALRGGALFAMGANGYGQLGDGTVTLRSSPVQVGADTDWTVIAAQTSSSLGIRGGKLFAWGRNNTYQLGDGTNVNRSSPVQIGAETDWTYVVGGYQYALGLRGGRLFSWGVNSNGELGLGDRTIRSSPVQVGSATNWTAIVAGNDHCLGLRGGQLFAWGANFNGQLGDGTGGTGTYKSSPVRIGSLSDWRDVAAGDLSSFGIR